MYRTVLGIQEMVVCVFSVQYSVTGMMRTALTAHIDDSRTSIVFVFAHDLSMMPPTRY